LGLDLVQTGIFKDYDSSRPHPPSPERGGNIDAGNKTRFRNISQTANVQSQPVLQIPCLGGGQIPVMEPIKMHKPIIPIGRHLDNLLSVTA
jgi:hypothetical protein